MLELTSSFFHLMLEMLGHCLRTGYRSMLEFPLHGRTEHRERECHTVHAGVDFLPACAIRGPARRHSIVQVADCRRVIGLKSKDR